MKIFITGGSGLLGSKVAEIAIEKGYEVYSGYCNHMPKLGEPIRFDLANPESIVGKIESVKPDVIIHSAALTDVDKCERERGLAFKINVEGTKVIAETAKRLGSFLVYISTDYVFDGNKDYTKRRMKLIPLTTMVIQNCWEKSTAKISVLQGHALYMELGQQAVRSISPCG